MTLPIVQNSNKLENAMFRNLDLFPSSGEETEKPILFGSLERAILSYRETEKYHENSHLVQCISQPKFKLWHLSSETEKCYHLT
jgi:hypothetical protein